MTVRFIAEKYRVSKLGNSDDEIEDKTAIHSVKQAATRRGRYAVADGATTTSFSAEWATMLVNDAIAGEPISIDTLAARIRPLQQEWSQTISAKQLPWYAQEKARQGAFASLLTLQLDGRRDASIAKRGTWTAAAVGDSCLFVVRGGMLERCFPINTSSDFDGHPVLIASIPNSNPPTDAIKIKKGEWHVGDRFFLMTDALAQWFLRSAEQGGFPWQQLVDLSLSTAEGWFPVFVAQLCETGEMRNDDATLVIVEVVDGD